MSFYLKLFFFGSVMFFTTGIVAQSRFDFYVNPFVQKIGILDKYYAESSNEFIDVDYTKIPSQHVGFNWVFNHSKKYQFYLGIQHTTNHYQMNCRFFRPNYDPSFVVYTQEEGFETQNVGFKIGFKRNVNATIVLNANFGFIATYFPKENSLYHHAGLILESEYINGNPTGYFNYAFSYKVTTGGLYPQLFIPELSVEFHLTDQLYLNVGTQFKFWDLDKESGYIDVRVDGKTTSTSLGELELLHFSRIKRTEFNYFFGLTYRFLTKKKS